VQGTCGGHSAQALIHHPHWRNPECFNLSGKTLGIISRGGSSTLQVNGQADNDLEWVILQHNLNQSREGAFPRQCHHWNRHSSLGVRPGNTDTGLTDVDSQPDALPH
jgi:hypothetical protein